MVLLIKSNNDAQLDKYCVKNKLHIMVLHQKGQIFMSLNELI